MEGILKKIKDLEGDVRKMIVEERENQLNAKNELENMMEDWKKEKREQTRRILEQWEKEKKDQIENKMYRMVVKKGANYDRIGKNSKNLEGLIKEYVGQEVNFRVMKLNDTMMLVIFEKAGHKEKVWDMKDEINKAGKYFLEEALTCRERETKRKIIEKAVQLKRNGIQVYYNNKFLGTQEKDFSYDTELGYYETVWPDKKEFPLQEDW